MSTITITAPYDNAVVNFERNGAFATHDWDSVYFGREGFNKVIPKVRDWIVKPLTGEIYVVTGHEPATYVPIYREIGSGSESGFTETAAQPDTYRAYYDGNQNPAILKVDGRFTVHDADASYARVYRGTDTTRADRIISAIYDNQGQLISNNVPLVDVARNNVTGIIQKGVRSCSVNTKLNNGETITLVFFTAQDRITSTAVMKVIQGSWVLPEEADGKHITHISLSSPYQNSINPTRIEVPINIQLNAMNFHGILHYSDGSQSTPQPIDGTKWSLLGLDHFVGVYPSQTSSLGLRYRLDPNEAASGATTADGKFMTTPYTLVTMPQNGALTVKLAGYPVWNQTDQAYRLRWFMTDLNRDVNIDVTNFVYYNASSDVFSGTRLGVIQNLSVRINLNDVSKAYPSVIHTQTQSLTLDKLGTDSGANWRIAFDINQTPLYGEQVHALCTMVNQNLWRVNMRFGAVNVSEWLQRAYYAARPIYDPSTEAKAPEPTHFAVFQGSTRTEVPVSQWDREFQVSQNLYNQTALQVEWVVYEGSTRLILASTIMPLKQVA